MLLEALRTVFLVQNVLSSLAMGLYMHRVLFGQLWIFAAYNPTSFDGSLIAFWIAIPMLVYLLSQTVAVAFRPPGSVYMVVIAWISSIFPVAEVGVSFFKFGMTPLQSDAWWIWFTGEGIDLLLIVISARLLQRSFYGDVQRVHPMF